MSAKSVPEINGRARSTSVELARLVDVVGALRDHCPWTAALTHESLISYLVEESHEFIEALETGSSAEISGELGDILLQVVMHARLAQEAGEFDLADVARGLSEKMIRRSPHVFQSDGTLQESFPATLAEIEETWERVKAQERAAGDSAADGSGPASVPDSGPVPDSGGASGRAAGSASGSATGPFAGVPRSLPALSMAQKSVERARRAGLDVQKAEGHLLENSATEEKLGKVLFDVVLEAEAHGLDAERALRLAVRRFQEQH
ncbi:MazG nucleotide pyrophosphohydrolase domain-containing protein [Arthrobacter alpinus]|uniref:MazG nucleotide pyrophosphohydrolase domain-containing protein n=1 Tax=Arthrobacter alpinus TaxID=656366 RepID=UPI001ED99BAE|nr:MazG nucleotide pyrophosphohydrolase domain-containing protein [Arthrobacter alpinus]